MLSFMRDQGNDAGITEPTVRQPGGAASGPDGAEHRKNQEYLTVATGKQDVRKSTILLAVLFGIGLLCLWFMIKKSSPGSAGASQIAGIGAEEAQIELAIARLTGVKSEMFEGIEKIVKKFYEFSDVKQVGVDELVKNPFKMENFVVNVGQLPDTGNIGIDPQMLARRRLREQAKTMQLLSIMASQTGNCCMIDNKILFEGDLIGEFKVVEISDSFVRLQAGDVATVLRLSE